MRLLSKLFSFSKRSTNPFNDERYWNDFVASVSSTGITITPDTARRCAAVIACVRVLSETIAHLPFILYRRNGDSRVRETSHPLYKLLHDSPNRWQTSFEFREMMMGHVLLRGNAYAQKVMDGNGTIIELVPLNPTKVTPKMTQGGDVYYEFRPGVGGTVYIPAENMFHLRGYASDGLVGVSPITEARETVGLAIAAEEFGARTFQNDAQPGGILEHPGKLGEEAIVNLRKSMQEQHGGVQNARKYMILEEGMKWTRVGMSSQDTQWIETRKFQLEEIARIFRVPPHLIGHLERATFSNIEHQGLEFVTHTILPWLKRWEQAIAARLMTAQERNLYYSEFLVDGLLRGDIATRYNAYAVGRQWGWLSADDVRRFENMDALPNQQGAKYLVPLNMIDASRLDDYLLKTGNPNASVASNSDDEDDDDELEPLDYVEESRKTFRDALNRFKESNQAAFVGSKSFEPVFRSVIDRCLERISKSKKPFDQHRTVITEGLDPVVTGLLLLNERDDAEGLSKSVVNSFLDSWKGEDKSASELTQMILYLTEESVRLN